MVSGPRSRRGSRPGYRLEFDEAAVGRSAEFAVDTNRPRHRATVCSHLPAPPSRPRWPLPVHSQLDSFSKRQHLHCFRLPSPPLQRLVSFLGQHPLDLRPPPHRLAPQAAVRAGASRSADAHGIGRVHRRWYADATPPTECVCSSLPGAETVKTISKATYRLVSHSPHNRLSQWRAYS